MATEKSLSILMLPAYSNDANTYTSSLAKAIESRGHKVHEFTWKEAWLGKHDIFHFHWIDHPVSQSPLKSMVWALVFLCTCRVSKIRGTRLFMSLHDLEWHEQKNRGLHRWFRRQVHNMLHGAFSLSQDAINLNVQEYPELKRVPITIVPHPNYREDYPNTISREQARSKLGLPQNHTVFLFLGQIRPYKGVEDLLTTWSAANLPDATLLIAGKPLAVDLPALEKLADQPSVNANFSFVADDDLQVYFNACDLVVLPFKRILNSGSALLALSFDRPILVPSLGSLTELRDVAGTQWAKFYPPNELTPSELQNALLWLQTRDEETCSGINHLTWELDAELTLKGYSGTS